MKLIFSILLSFLSVISHAQTKFVPPTQEDIAKRVANLPQHPRLLLTEQGLHSLKKAIQQDASKQKIHQAILKECETILTQAPVQRIQIGRRLLDKSRECLRRVFYLSYAYRTTNDERFFKRAEQELLAVSNFSDWNPSHFLDVAEMTMGVAIGYDWLYHQLSTEARQTIKKALLEKGIQPSLDQKNNSFLRSENNWNQVCNAGITFGALAIAEDEPTVATQMIERGVKSIPISMQPYAPHGGYPEGYGYWEYGTSFNVLFIDAIEKALGTTYGLEKIEGFLPTVSFLQNMVAPIGKVYNWGDCGLNAGLSAASFWFAQKNNDPSVVWLQKKMIQESTNSFTRNRILPSLLIWSENISFDAINAPKETVWVGQGDSPTALFRSDWHSKDATYVGFKLGSASVNHAHMDVGSFIIDAQGERWAMDFGMQDYHSLESKGVNLWGKAQNAQRWQVMRYNNRAHNTLTIDDELHDVKGDVDIATYSTQENFKSATADLTPIFLPGKITSSKRGIALVDNKNVVIRDEMKTEKAVTLRWNWVTPAKAKAISATTFELEQNGKKMYLHFDTNAKITLKTWSTDPIADYDAKNPGTMMIGFEAALPSQSSVTINATFSANPKTKVKIQPLEKWPGQPLL